MTSAPIVSAAWLAKHRREVALADVRWYLDGRSGLDAYRGGHIPGAVFVDLDHDLSAPPSLAAGRHPVPSPEAFAAARSRLGLDDRTPVVAYDDAGGSIAARLVWMLRVLGLEAAVLDGGIGAWKAPLTMDDEARVPVEVGARPWPADRFADQDDVMAASHDGSSVILDARAAGRFTGEQVVAADPRPGHVPGACSAPWADNVDGDHRFLPADDLRRRFGASGLAVGDAPIVYCGSGVTACHDLLALEIAGVTDARLFVGSWSAWAADADLPVETGAG